LTSPAQAFGLEMRYQGVDEWTEFAFHHFGELVQRQVDPRWSVTRFCGL